MKPIEAQRATATDKLKGESENGFSGFYNRSRGSKLAVQLVLYVFVALFISFCTILGHSEEYSQSTSTDGQNGYLFLVWPSMVVLLHLFVYCRRCFCWCLLAGMLWLFFGDPIATPCWMAASGYFIALVSRQNTPAISPPLLLLVSGIAYVMIYEHVAHDWFFGLFIALTLLSAVRERWLVARARLHKVIATDAEPDIWSGRKNSLPPTVEKQAGRNDDKAPSDILEDDAPQLPFAPFWQELYRLQQQSPLPVLLQKELDGVIDYAQRILGCMQEDADDVQPGTAFLQRYLPQVANVVKRGLSLSQQLSLHGRTDEIEQQCLQALEALHSAFAQQHIRLLENDTLEFETDLSVLNSLLRTDGFKS